LPQLPRLAGIKINWQLCYTDRDLPMRSEAPNTNSPQISLPSACNGAPVEIT